MDRQTGQNDGAVLSLHTLVLLAVARNGSLAAAAKQLSLSVSTVSYHLHALEEALGLDLVCRESKPLRLTAEGLSLVREVQRARGELLNYIGRLQAQASQKPVLRLGIIESLSRNLGVGLIAGLIDQAVEISMSTGTSERLTELLLERELDAVIVSTKKIDHELLSSHVLLEEPSVVVLPKDKHFEALNIDWDSLRFCGIPFLRYNRHSGGDELASGLFNSLYFHLPHRIEVDDGGMMLSLVSAGLGWSLIRPATLLQYPTLAQKVFIRAMPQPFVTREISLAVRIGENQALFAQMRQIAEDFLHQQFVPQVCALYPWLSEFWTSAKLSEQP